MYAGKIVEQAQAKRLFGAGGSVKMRYTRALLDAIPHIERAAHTQLPVVSGRPARPDRAAARLLVRAPLRATRPTTAWPRRPPSPSTAPGTRWACWHPCENGVAQ